MAGKPVGIISIALDMDASAYKKAQAEIYEDAGRKTDSINKIYATVGTKSDAMYDAMRKQIQVAQDAIVSSTKSSAAERHRAEEGAHAKITALNEQQYGKQTSMIDSLKANWMGLAATATAAFYAIKNVVAEPIRAYMESEQALLKMGMAMKNQGDFTRAGLAGMQAHAEQIQRLTGYEDDATLAIMGNLKSYGMSNEEVKRATSIALDFATAKANEGMTIEKASEILGKSFLGITIGLKRQGIQIDENLKGTALFNSVLDQLNQRFGGSAQAELETYAGQWKQLKNQWQDVQEFLGLVFLKTIQGILTAAGLIAVTFMTAGQNILKMINMIMTPFNLLMTGFAYLAEYAGLTQTADALRSIATATDEAAASIGIAKEGALKWTDSQYKAMMATDSVSKAIEKMGKEGKRTQVIDEEASKAAKKAAQEKEQAIKSITEEIRKSNYEIEGIGRTQYEKDIARITSEAEKYRGAGVDSITVAKYVALEKTIAQKKESEEQAKIALKTNQEITKAENDMRKEGEEGTKVTLASIKKMEDEHWAGINKWFVATGEAEEKMRKEGEEGAALSIEKIRKWEDEKTKLWQKSGDEAVAQWGRDADAGVKASLDTIAWLEKRGDVFRQLYRDLRGYENVYYEASRELIIQQSKDFEEKLIRPGITSAEESTRIRLAIKAREIEELALLDMKALKSGNDFFGGMKAGFLELERATTSWGTIGANMVKTFSTDATKQLSDNFFNIVKGDFDKLQFDFESLMDSMLRILTNKLAEMVVNWVLYGNAVAAVQAAGAAGNIAGAGGIVGGVSNLLSGGGSIASGASAVAGLFSGGAPAFGGAGMAMAPGAMGAGTGIMAGLGTAMPYIGAAILLDQLTGGNVMSGIGDIVGGLFGGGGSSMSPEDRLYYTAYWQHMRAQGYPGIMDTYWDESAGEHGEQVRGYGYVDLQGQPYSLNSSEYLTTAAQADIAGRTARGYVSGLDYVPYDNFPVRLHKGERVQTAEEARGGGDGADLPPVQVNWNVDGRTLASLIYKQTKSGVKVIHSRGVTSI